jgi:hypothetical protein
MFMNVAHSGGCEVVSMASFVNGIVKRLAWYDFSVLKVSLVFFGLWLAKAVPAVLGMNLWVYVAVWALGFAYLLVKAFR